MDDAQAAHAGREASAPTRKLLLIGSVGCGKTTFLQRLKGLERTYSKTQAIYTFEGVSDTPGELVDSIFLKPALRLASLGVDLILFLQAANVSIAKIPPMFTTFFPKPAIGVVTKIDLASEAEIAHAKSVLGLTGVREIFPVSSVTGEGFEELIPRLE